MGELPYKVEYYALSGLIILASAIMQGCTLH
jgi:hypothetical protein